MVFAELLDNRDGREQIRWGGGQAPHGPITSDVGGINNLSRVPLRSSSIMRSRFGGALSSATQVVRIALSAKMSTDRFVESKRQGHRRRPARSHEGVEHFSDGTRCNRIPENILVIRKDALDELRHFVNRHRVVLIAKLRGSTANRCRIGN